MSNERYNELMSDQDLRLTQEELNAGWFFCDDCDQLLTTHENCCLNAKLDFDLPIIF